MPELPEVETVRSGIEPVITDKLITNAVVREKRLRRTVPSNFKKMLIGKKVLNVRRRAKYLIIELDDGNIIIHLGMSGCLKIVNANDPVIKHDHVDLVFDDVILRYNDPRRFGFVAFEQDPTEGFAHLGVEPLQTAFTAKYLLDLSSNRKVALKQFLMDQKIVVGVGNIYACEVLYNLKLSPTMPANNLTIDQCQSLVKAIKVILKKAIKSGGTTLKDFRSADGKPGYFVQKLLVYGREGQPCKECDTDIERETIGQRSTFFCPVCQG